MARILVQSIARYFSSAIVEELRRDVARLVRPQVQVRRRDTLLDRIVATTVLSYIYL